MAINNGTIVSMTIGGTEINNLTTNSMSLTMGERQTSTKDDGGFDSFLPTRVSGTASGSILFDEAATYGYEEMWDAFIAGTVADLVYTTGVSAQKEYTTSAFFTELSREDPDSDNSSVSFSLRLTGTQVKGTIS